MKNEGQESTITTENTVIDQEPDQPESQAPEPEKKPEPTVLIESFDVFEIAGLRYVIGLGEDNQMYNWNVRTGKWQLFVVREANQPGSEGVAVDLMDGIL